MSEAGMLLALALTVLVIWSCTAGARGPGEAVLIIVAVWVVQMIWENLIADRVEAALKRRRQLREKRRELEVEERRKVEVEERTLRNTAVVESEPSIHYGTLTTMKWALFDTREDALASASEVIDKEIYRKTRVCTYCSTPLADPVGEISLRHTTIHRSPPPGARDLKIVERKGWKARVSLSAVTCSKCGYRLHEQSFEIY